METEQLQRKRADLLLEIHNSEETLKSCKSRLNDFKRSFEKLCEQIEKEQDDRIALNLDYFPSKEDFVETVTILRSCYLRRGNFQQRRKSLGLGYATWDDG